jgi:hypothetical protein
MEFDNWEVTEEGIQGLDNMGNFFITKEDMVSLDIDGCIDILVHTASKDIVGENDIVNLNKAYQQALYSFGIKTITDEMMASTIKKQLKHI